MNRLSLRKNRLKLETSREFWIILEESIECTSNCIKQTRKRSSCNHPAGFRITRILTDSLYMHPKTNFPGPEEVAQWNVSLQGNNYAQIDKNMSKSRRDK